MMSKAKILIVIVILASAIVLWFWGDQFLVTRDGPLLKADLEALHEKAMGGENGVPGKARAEDLPEIDFPMMDQARSLDLIDMELDFPESLRKLEGQRVSLVGFMAPFDSLDDMRRCMIVPSYVGCTFCSPPSLTQVVYVTQGGAGESMRRPFPFIEEPSYITGILRLSLPGNDHEGTQQGFIYSIENAVVTPHAGDAPTRTVAHQTVNEGRPAHKPGALLSPIEIPDLVREVAEIIDQKPITPLEIETVSSKEFSDLVRTELGEAFPEESLPARVRAFSMLGMIPEDCDWMEALAGTRLAMRSAISGKSGERIYLLKSVEQNHPYVRLDLVGAITDAIVCQHFPGTAEGIDGGESDAAGDDARRAEEALRAGIRGMAVYRYSRSQGISPAAPLPTALFQRSEAREFVSVGFELWQALPGDVGPFFVDYLVGATGPFAGVEAALARPPSATIELFRPRWYEDQALWQPNPVPEGFADDLIDTPPTLTDVLGIGGLVPWLVQWYPVEAAKGLAGKWAGDRWGVWLFPDGNSALVLETRWQDEEAALKFREAIPEDPRQRFLPYEPGSKAVRLIRATSEDALSKMVPDLQPANQGL